MPDTPTTRRLSLPGYLHGSGLSYDERFFAYSDDDANLAVFEMATGKSDILVRAHDGQFAQLAIMSPDGAYVAYQWWTGEDRRTYEIRVADRVTKADRVLIGETDSLDVPSPIEWSRDGTQILLWASTRGRVGRIALVDVVSGEMRIVKEVRGPAPLGMSLSSDARYVVYDVPTAGEISSRQLRIVGTDGNGDRTLFPDTETSDRFPLWTPDGRQVFFISDRSGAPDGWLVPVTDGVATDNPILAVRNLSRVASLGITEQGSFYYRLQSGAFDVEEVDVDRTTLAPVSKPRRVATRFFGSNIGPGYSPDGRLLSFVLVRQGLGSGTNSIVIRDRASGTERELNPPLDLGFAPPKWSPDGRRLLVRAGDDTGGRGARVIDATTGAVEAAVFSFGKDESDYGTMAWAPDGEAVLYDHEPRGIVRHSLNGHAEEVLLKYSPDLPIKRIHRFAVSPDGSQIALNGWSFDGSTNLFLVKDASGVRELVRRTQPELAVVQAWSPDGQFVAFTTLRYDRPPPHELWRVPAAGGEATRVGLSIPGGTQINPMAFSPTGSALAYTTGSPLQELWMMENFLPR
jgi:Tol biopolymer transport system component